MSGGRFRLLREQADGFTDALTAGGLTRPTAVKLLTMFPADENYALLEQAMAAGDTDAAFRAAHTLKGVCGNLCLEELYRTAAPLSDALKRGDTDTAARLFEEMRPVYRDTVAALETLR
ncbi:MAG: Hpt domain-containing protein [Spirochaetia bacterium]|nr:Hpt domain-containing protein [Spirochaetia bacterium]